MFLKQQTGTYINNYFNHIILFEVEVYIYAQRFFSAVKVQQIYVEFQPLLC